MQPPIGFADPVVGRRLVAKLRISQEVDECLVFILRLISAHDKGASSSRLVSCFTLVETLDDILRDTIQSLGKVVGRNVGWCCGKDLAERCLHGKTANRSERGRSESRGLKNPCS